MSDLILPPSPNWFQHNAVSSRFEDRLLVTACFRNIVIYKVLEEKAPLKILKLIPSIPGKVTGLSLHPNHLHPDLGHTFAVTTEHCMIALVDLHQGIFLVQHQVQKCAALNSLCWGFVKGDDIVVAVGDKGTIVVWHPKYHMAKSFILESKKTLTVVEVVPHSRDEALIASDKTILLVALQTGDIITQFKGHNNPIYCIRFYLAAKNPRDVDRLTMNTNWRQDEDESKDSSASDRDSREDERASGPFFASSDLGRTILFWDLSEKRYLANSVAPVSYSNSRKLGKDQSQRKNHHITLNWADGKLYSNTVMGEIIEWNLSVSDPKCKLVTQSHVRAVYNMEVMGSLLITFSQDRTIRAYDLSSSSHFFNVPTMGVCPNSMAFSPHDASRLAIGVQEAIELLTFRADSPLKMQSLRQNIKGKVLSLSWHPTQEGKLLFGTSEGQVGIADVFTNRMLTFAYFHQKAAYKVEWAPAVAPQKTGLKELWYAYSFGDGELLCYSASDVMQKPVVLNDMVGLEKISSNSLCLSEFAFSPDFVFLALGFLSGQIHIHDRLALECRLKILRVRKVIQHLLWKPPTSTDRPYVIGVASGENSAFIFDLEVRLQESEKSEEPLTLFQATRELSSHTSRVIWLSWSPHSDGILATASYDHTVQLWNVNSGEPLGNYGGHSHRVFRAEFSPTDADKVLSFAEENCIHVWRPSQLTSRTPVESAAALKEQRKKSKAGFITGRERSSNEEESEISEPVGGTSDKPISDISAVGAVKKKLPKKSSFPLFHIVSSRKRTFHHMCILSLMEAIEADRRKALHKKENENLSEDLEEEPEPNHLNGEAGDAPSHEEFESHAANALIKYGHFMPADHPLPEVEDMSFYLNFFGTLPQMDEMVSKEIKNHEKNDNFGRANLMRCWQGSLESHVKWAARHKQLDPFLVSAAPQVSFSLWEYACEAYAEQLVEADDPVTAATYLISIHKDEEAVNLLIESKNYREAFCIAKYRMGFNKEAISKVIDAWYRSSVFEGNFEVACILQLCLGNPENAARALARRTEVGSLVVAAQLFLSSGCFELAKSTAIVAFKEASGKREFHKFDPILKSMPDLNWCTCIIICHQSILDYIASHELSSCRIISATDENITLVNCGSTQESIFESNLLRTVLERWKQNGIVLSTYSKYLENIRENFVEKNLPTSLKHLWFLISVLLSEMLLSIQKEDENKPQWEKSLESALECVEFWGKTDQIYYLTHLLLPEGITDLSTLQVPVQGDEDYIAINHLKELYISSEAEIILSLLKGDGLYVPWKKICSTEAVSNKLNGHMSSEKVFSLAGESIPHRNTVGVLEKEANNCKEKESSTENLACFSGEGQVSDNLIFQSETNAEDNNSKANSEIKSYESHLFECRDDFFHAFDGYLDYFTLSFNRSTNYDKHTKLLSDVLSCLHERSVCVPSSLAAKIDKIK